MKGTLITIGLAFPWLAAIIAVFSWGKRFRAKPKNPVLEIVDEVEP